jgi:hypothetical protein
MGASAKRWFESAMPAPERHSDALVLRELALSVSDDGVGAVMSASEIAGRTGLSVRSVFRSLRESGHISPSETGNVRGRGSMVGSWDLNLSMAAGGAGPARREPGTADPGGGPERETGFEASGKVTLKVTLKVTSR